MRHLGAASGGCAERRTPRLPRAQVFLRELVSNASDALDKIRFVRCFGAFPCASADVADSAPADARSVTDKDALAATSDLCIRIKGDKDSKTLVIEGELRCLASIARQADSDARARRHRHRHDQGGAGGFAWHHRPQRHRQVHGGYEGEGVFVRRGGRRQQPHRPLRRGLLLRFPGCRSHHRSHQEQRRQHHLGVGVVSGLHAVHRARVHRCAPAAARVAAPACMADRRLAAQSACRAERASRCT